MGQVVVFCFAPAAAKQGLPLYFHLYFPLVISVTGVLFKKCLLVIYFLSSFLKNGAC